ncbi:MAG TPA: PilZ domain-containing protein [Terriglobales bacterium]|nr:PilZ domain-containing protein [Terriglobales bacterium]
MATGATTSGTGSLKLPVRVALVNLDETTSAVLRECFQQSRIATVAVSGIVEPRLAREKFDACVVRLNEQAGKVLETLRSSRENQRAFLYGVARSSEEAFPFTRHGINALFLDPVEREAALKVVQSTQNLVTGHMRLFVRVPLVTEVILDAEGKRHSCYSQEVSGGGMAMVTSARPALNRNVSLAFSLPGLPRLAMNAIVSYVTEAESLLGVRFSPSGDRDRVRKWVDDYLGAIHK